MTVVWDDTAFQERITKAAMRGVVRATELVRSEAISLILNGEKTGRVYQRGRVSHQASAPGEAPASDTGRLVNSIETRYDPAALMGVVNIGVDYGLYLEFGTQSIEPRPFLRPALANKQSEIQSIIQEEIAAELRK